jgi:hypothetical protein
MALDSPALICSSISFCSRLKSGIVLLELLHRLGFALAVAVAVAVADDVGGRG